MSQFANKPSALLVVSDNFLQSSLRFRYIFSDTRRFARRLHAIATRRGRHQSVFLFA